MTNSRKGKIKKCGTQNQQPQGTPRSMGKTAGGRCMQIPNRMRASINVPKNQNPINLLQNATIPKDNGLNIRKKLRERTLLAARDGSYKCETSSFGFSIQGTDNNAMYGGGKCATHPLSASSFDAEAHGALAITQAFLLLVPKRKRTPKLHFTALIDNEEVIKTINQILTKGDIHPMTPCYEIFAQIHENISKLWFNGSWKWIKSHNLDDTSDEALLNNIVDELANKFRTDSSPPLQIFPLSASPYTMFYQNKPILYNFLKALKSAATKNESDKYLKRKFQWSSKEMEEIEWESFEKTIKKRKLGNRITTIKNIYAWSNTETQKEQLHGHHPTCPVCKTEKETVSHMFICKKQPHHKIWNTCKSMLQQIGTIPPVITSIRRILLRIQPPPNNNEKI